MQNICYLFLWAICAFIGPIHALHAQDCPPPQNLQITILEGDPTMALVSWDAPPFGGVQGFLFTYSIDGKTPITIVLPPNPTSYIIELPDNWEEIEATLTTICADGKLSSEESIKKTSLILVDLIMIRSDGVPEQSVCTGNCPTATHFCYGVAGNTLPYLNLYNNTMFCKCMNDNGNAYQDPEVVAACKLHALQVVDPGLYYFRYCAINQRNDSDDTNFNRPTGQIRLIPNPVSGQYVHFDGSNNSGILDCWDVSGRLVLTQSLSGPGQPISVESLGAGIYFYRIQASTGQVAYGKLMKH